MALVLVSDPLSPSCNSYVSLQEAAEYAEYRVVDATVFSAWDSLDEEQQAKYLVNASRALDSMCDWIGSRYSSTQGLKWPRVDAAVDGFYLTSTVVPTPVKEAAIEMALWSMANDGVVATTSNTQFDSIKVGPIEIDFNEGSGIATNQYFPDVVTQLLRDYGGITQPNVPSNRSMRTAKLVRS